MDFTEDREESTVIATKIPPGSVKVRRTG